MKSRFNPWSFAWRELTRNKVFSLLFVVNLSLGLSGIAFVEQFKAVFQRLMQERSLSILGADLAVNSRFAIEPEQVAAVMAKLPPETETVTLGTLMSMARGNQFSRLVSLSIVDRGYPYYGKIELQELGGVPRPDLLAPAPTEVWVYPELLGQLGVSVGEEILIGTSSYKVADLVRSDPGQTMRMGGIAPKVFLSQAGLERAGLLGEGATVRYSAYFKLPPEFGQQRERFAEEITTALGGTDLRVRTPTDASEGLARGLNYLTDFLGLVSLVALFLASVGLFYLYRSYLASKRKELAILNFLGLQKGPILSTFSLHLCFLGLIGTASSLLLITFVFPTLISFINTILPFTLSSELGLRALLATIFVGVGGTVLLCLPLIKPIVETQAIELLRDRAGQKTVMTLKRAGLFLPWILFSYALALWMSGSIKVGSLFVGIIALVAAALFPLGSFCLRFIARGEFQKVSLALRIALGYLSRFRFATLSLFFALTMSVTLLHLIPQLEENLKEEFVAPVDGSLPALFLFDIQEEQKEALEQIASDVGVETRLISPMVRARLTKVNDRPYRREERRDLTREEEEETRSRNRGLNLSYRNHLDSSETLVAGKPFSDEFDPLAEVTEVSLEQRWAERIGARVGDTLTFEIFGLEIKARVVNLRRVRWTSFVPNFFVVLRPGVLEDAPKTYVAAMKQMDATKKAEFQRRIYSELSNISSIDVSTIIERLLGILSQMAMALKLMSILSLIVGLLVLYSLINHQMRERARDLVLLKVLGASTSLIKKSVRWQLLLLTGVSAVSGLIFSTLIVWVLARELFEGLRTFNFALTLGVLVSTILLGVVVGELSARRWLKLRAREALQEA